LHARNVFVNEEELTSHGFQQNPNFFYFTGLASAANAILALDGTTKESWLFVPASLDAVEKLLPNASVPIGNDSEHRLQIDHVVHWQEFAPYLDRRLRQKSIALYVDDSYWIKPPASNPAELQPISDTPVLWRNALAQRWPSAEIRSAREIISELRAIKSPAEIQIIRRVATTSAVALLAGIQGLKPGRTQREVEAEVVFACISAGAEGPSFWPWVMSGPNAVLPKPFESLADYRHLNRRMLEGELVRVDVGSDADFYKGDVGRTAPVSGRFSPAQRETWDLLVKAYQAGLSVIRPGARHGDIVSACRNEVKTVQPTLLTPLAKEAATMLLDPANRGVWHLHSSGLEPGEKGPAGEIKAGMILEFEPTFALSGQGFYLEDMILVTVSGYEILTLGLPYTADEIEQLMARAPIR
jgi:Xaa-Pro aminopeptidase